MLEMVVCGHVQRLTPSPPHLAEPKDPSPGTLRADGGRRGAGSPKSAYSVSISSFWAIQMAVFGIFSSEFGDFFNFGRSLGVWRAPLIEMVNFADDDISCWIRVNNIASWRHLMRYRGNDIMFGDGISR